MARAVQQQSRLVRRHGPTVDDVTVVDESKTRKAVGAAAIGNTMEWFDFGVYSYLAVTIGQVFFPSGNPTAQLLSTFATFAVAFLVRPLGGFVFGPLGDRFGRRTVLAITMLTMAVGTFAIGIIPSFEQIGMWAPVLLLTARLVQGFSTGGEYGGATTFVSEFSPDRRRGFMASWLEFGTLGGYALGAALVTMLSLTLPEPAMLSWGWRIPFLLAAPLGLIGLYLRFRLEDTPAYEQSSEHGSSEDDGEAGEGGTVRSVWRLFVDYRNAMLKCVGLVLVFNVTNYMLTAYMPTYLSSELGYPHTSALVFVLTTMVVVMGLIVVLGRYSDRFGRLPIIAGGSIALIILSLPAFLLMSVGSIPAVFGGLLVLGLMLICFSSTMPSTLPALFPTAVRYGGVSIGFNISVALFGGTTPFVAEALIAGTGITWIPAVMLMVAGAIGLVAIRGTREPDSRPLPGSAPTAASRGEARERAKEEQQRETEEQHRNYEQQ